MSEKWRDIEGYKNIYQVSSLGNIKSMERIIITKAGVRRRVEARVMYQATTKGYRVISLRKNGSRKTFKSHTLVARAFLPLIKDKTHINHKNLNKADNRVINLEWCNHQENIKHAHDNGCFHKGEQLSYSKLTDKKVLNIRKTHSDFIKKTAIDNKVTVSTIRNILNGKYWKHLKEN